MKVHKLYIDGAGPLRAYVRRVYFYSSMLRPRPVVGNAYFIKVNNHSWRWCVAMVRGDGGDGISKQEMIYLYTAYRLLSTVYCRTVYTAIDGRSVASVATRGENCKKRFVVDRMYI